eukprot:scaffold696_cov239-Skeletonema_marinoi.AAC.2
MLLDLASLPPRDGGGQCPSSETVGRLMWVVGVEWANSGSLKTFDEASLFFHCFGSGHINSSLLSHMFRRRQRRRLKRKREEVVGLAIFLVISREVKKSLAEFAIKDFFYVVLAI